jgi:hypothetical protein
MSACKLMRVNRSATRQPARFGDRAGQAACLSHILHVTSADAGLSVRVCDTLHPSESSRHPAGGRAVQ